MLHALLIGICWTEQVAAAGQHPSATGGGSIHAAHNKNGDGGKSSQWAAHAHRHHHRLGDQNNNNNNNNQDYVQDMASASEDNLVDYETDDNSETGNNDVNGDASPLMGVLPEVGSYVPSNCTSCIQREELRRRNLEVIKDQILSKLGMQRAPNMTGRLPPRIPPLDHLLDLYGMQGDAPPGRHTGHHGVHHPNQQSDQAFQTGPVYDEEDDDFHARTEKVIAFSQLCKLFFSFIDFSSCY